VHAHHGCNQMQAGELGNRIDADALTGDEGLAKAFDANAELNGDPDAQLADAELKQADDQALTSLNDKTNVFDKEQLFIDTTCTSWMASTVKALTPDFERYAPEVPSTVFDEQIASATAMRRLADAVHKKEKERANVAASEDEEKQKVCTRMHA
jgi:hypothetical protein